MADCTVRKKAECRKPCGEAGGFPKGGGAEAGSIKRGGI